MSVLKKILIGLLVIVVLIVAAAYAALKTGIFTASAKEYAKNEIMRLTGKEIDIEKIELGLINNIVIRNVSIPLKRNVSEGGEFLTVGSIIFRFNFIDLFIYKKNIDRTLSHVIVESPVAHVKRENGKFNIEDFLNSFAFSGGQQITGTAQAAPKIVLPVNRVLVENGRIIYDDMDRKFSTELESIKGSITYRQKSNSLKIYLAGKTPGKLKPLGLDARNIKADVTVFLSGGGFKANLQVKDEDLSRWMPYAVPQGGVTVTAGVFSADVTAQGDAPAPGKFKMAGTVSMAHGSAQAFLGREFSNIDASVSVLNDSVTINQSGFNALGGRVAMKGRLNDIFGKINYDGTASLTGIDAALINKDTLEGRLRGAVNIKGEQDRPILSGNLIWDAGTLAGMPVRNLEILSTYGGNRVELKEIKGSIGGGAVSGSGTMALTGGGKKQSRLPSGISFAIKGLNASALFRDNGVRGKIDAGVKITGPLDNPRLQASLRSESVDFNGTPAGNIKGELLVSRPQATLNAAFDYASYKNLALNGRVEFREGLINLSSFELKQGKQSLASAAGSYQKKSKAISLLSSVSGVRIPFLGIKALEGKSIEGMINGKFQVKGTSDAPLVEAVLDTSGMKVSGEPQLMHAKATYGGDSVRIEEFAFNDNVAGNGEFSVKKKIFNLNMDVKNLSGAVLREMTGLKIFENSTINGTAVIKKEKEGYGGNVALEASYSKGNYRSVNIDITGEKNEFSINKIYVRQKQGTLKLDGNAKVQNGDTLLLSARGALRDYMINDRCRISGDFLQDSEMTAGGGAGNSTTKINISKLFINDIPQDDLDLSLSIAGDSVPSLDVKWGEKYAITGSIAGGDDPSVKLAAVLKAADLLPVYALLGKRDKGLKPENAVSGRLELSGPISGASVSGSLSQKLGTAGVTGDVAFKKENTVYRPSRVNLQYNLVNVDINNFAGIFDENFRQTGRANGRGIVRGKPDSLESSGELALSGGKLLDMPYDSISAKYTYKDKVIALDRMLFNYRETSLNIHDSQLQLLDNNVYLATIKSDMKDFSWQNNRLNGALNFYGRIDNFKGLKIDGSISSDNFSFKNHTFQPFVIKTYMDGSGISLKTSKGGEILNAVIKTEPDRLTFEDCWLQNQKGEKYVSAGGFLAKDKGDSDMQFTGQGVSPQMVNDLLGWDHRWTGTLGGNVKISGNLRDGLAYTIMVTANNGMVDDLDFDIFSGLISVKNNWVDLSPVDPLLLSKTGKYDVKVSGKVPAPSTPEAEEKMKGTPMDLHAVLKGGDLSIIKFLTWIDDASGPLDVDLHITGTKEFPNVSGKIEVTDASVRLKYLFDKLTHFYANILIKENVMDIYKMQADTEKHGTLKIENLDEKKGGTMKWIKPYEVNWRVTNIGDKVKFSDTQYMEFIDGLADLDLSITGQLASPNISGTIKISDMRYRYPPKMKDKTGGPAEIKNNYVAGINWDLKISGGENNYFFNDDYTNTYAQLYLKFPETPLLMQGKGGDMRLSGNLGIMRGTYRYMSTEFQVDDMKESKIVFDGEMKPILDMYAKTKLMRMELATGTGGGFDISGVAGKRIDVKQPPVDIDVIMHAWGRVGDVKIDLTSDPSFDRNRLLSMITTGRDSTSVTSDDAVKMATQLANMWIKGGTNQLKKLVPGVDVLDIKVDNLMPGQQPTPEPAGNTPTGTVKAEIGLGKYFGDKVYVGYTVRLLEAQNLLMPQDFGLNIEHAFDVEYSLDKTSKLIFGATMRDPNYYWNPFEGTVKYQYTIPIGSWNEKPTPVPTKTK
jgi:hypothetical protein